MIAMIYKIPTFQTCKCANAVPIPPARQSFQDKRRNQVNTGLNFSRNNVILIATRTLVRASISPFMPPFNIPMCMWLKVLSSTYCWVRRWQSMCFFNRNVGWSSSSWLEWIKVWLTKNNQHSEKMASHTDDTTQPSSPYGDIKNQITENV